MDDDDAVNVITGGLKHTSGNNGKKSRAQRTRAECERVKKVEDGAVEEERVAHRRRVSGFVSKERGQGKEKEARGGQEERPQR